MLISNRNIIALLNEYFDYGKSGNMFENMQHVKCELFSQKGNRICKANPLTKLHHQTAETEQYNTPISHKT